MKSNRVLIVFCDGTGMDGVMADPKSGNAVTAASGIKGGTKHQATNILRLSRAIKEYSADGSKRQIVYYQSGVASFADFGGNLNSFATVLQATGTVVASKIRDAYAFIAQNYEEGDEIALFGFSRGAYTARKVAGLIDRIGLLSRNNLGHFFSIWLQLMKGQDPYLPPDTLKPHIKLVGVYDTVGSVMGMEDALNIKDNSLPASVDNAIHILALHENREKFMSTLWAEPHRGLRKGQVLKQVWFAGAHSDVSGSYGDRHELGDIALFWLVGEIKDLLHIDLDFIARVAQPNPEPWGTSQPHNSYDDIGSGIKQDLIGHGTRFESGQITANSIFHQSFQFSPDLKQLKQPNGMVTMSALKAKFGANWTPKYAPLNAFEKERKARWGDLSAHSESAGISAADAPIDLEDYDLDSLSKYIVKGN